MDEVDQSGLKLYHDLTLILWGQAMRMRFTVTLLIAVFMLVFTSFTSAAEDIIVAGEPPVTMHAVDCHIRLLEFVLNTRLTVAQKDSFLGAIKEECGGMTVEEKEGFLEAVALVASMTEMDEDQHEAVQGVLTKDFQESAADLPDDPAAQLFLKLQTDSFKFVIKNGDSGVSQQALDAFSEYLAFLAQPEQTVWFNASTTEAINDTLIKNFETLTPEEKESLDDFHFTWFMVRAAWQGTQDAVAKTAWRKKIAAIGLKAGETPDLKAIKAALSTDFYGDLLDECAKLGVEALEWSSGTTFRVW